ncbi:MAG: hypothetical protein E6Q97_36685, partial [Desulfurellales bacterium]
FNTATEWRNPQGGGCLALGVDGPFTGKGCNLLIVDDPHKNRQEAESELLRYRVWEWFTGTASTRVEPGGSIIVFHQRFHRDDLIGRLTRDDNQTEWEYINLPAIVDDQPLWPERWTLEQLQALELEVGAYNWASQYCGNPVPRGGKVFLIDPTRYASPNVAGCRVVLSVDAAGTEKTTSDYTAAIALAVSGNGPSMTVDVLEVEQHQTTPEKSAEWLLKFQERWGNGKMLIESSRDGVNIAAIMRKIEPRIRLREVPPIGDKFTRAQAVAGAWNQGRVRVPMHAPWLKDFLYQVTNFTGIGSTKDDMVDALSQGFNNALSFTAGSSGYL